MNVGDSVRLREDDYAIQQVWVVEDTMKYNSIVWIKLKESDSTIWYDSSDYVVVSANNKDL